MDTITFKADEKLHKRLAAIAKKQERSKGFILRKMLEEYLVELEEDEEDYRDAVERLKNDDPSKWVSLDEIERKYGLDD